jgi:hypothetical protein
MAQINSIGHSNWQGQVLCHGLESIFKYLESIVQFMTTSIVYLSCIAYFSALHSCLKRYFSGLGIHFAQGRFPWHPQVRSYLLLPIVMVLVLLQDTWHNCNYLCSYLIPEFLPRLKVPKESICFASISFLAPRKDWHIVNSNCL